MKKVFWICPFSRCLVDRAIRIAGVLIPELLKKDIQLINIFFGDYCSPDEIKEAKYLKEELIKGCNDYMDKVAEIVDSNFGGGSFFTTYKAYVDSSATFLPAYDYDCEHCLDNSEILAKLDEILGVGSQDLKVINEFYYKIKDDKKYSLDYSLATAIHNYVINQRKETCLTGSYLAPHYKAKEWAGFYNENYPNDHLPDDFKFLNLGDMHLLLGILTN